MESFFANLTGTPLVWDVCIMRILLSFLAGCLMGLERKFRMRFVGIRTLVLICVSSCVIMMLSIYLSYDGNGDPARLAAQVVSGIGFLGGGAILREGFNVKGLTSAAIIWTAAALGLAIGAGFLLPALMALGIALITLVLIELLEEHFFPAEELKILFLTCEEFPPDPKLLKGVASKFGVIVTSLNGASSSPNSLIEVSYEVRITKYVDFQSLVTTLRQDFKLVDIELR